LRKSRKYDAAAVRSSIRRALAVITALAAASALAACGSEGITVAEDDPAYAGAELFSQRCSGCHTLNAAGAEGSADRELRVQGPNLDQREVTYEDALYAIRNGGFSGAIMPQNIVVGEEAESVAEFVSEYAGTEVEKPPVPGSDSETTSGG
jgi:mono/diheme cytochrome c family protein